MNIVASLVSQNFLGLKRIVEVWENIGFEIMKLNRKFMRAGYVKNACAI